MHNAVWYESLIPVPTPLLFPVIPPLIPPPRLQFRDCLTGIHNLLGAKEGDDVGTLFFHYIFFGRHLQCVVSLILALLPEKGSVPPSTPPPSRNRGKGMQREETGSRRRRRRRVINRSFVRCPPSLRPSLPFPPFLPLKTGCWVQAERERHKAPSLLLLLPPPFPSGFGDDIPSSPPVFFAKKGLKAAAPLPSPRYFASTDDRLRGRREEEGRAGLRRSGREGGK